MDVVPVRSGPGQELEPLLQEGCTFTVLDQPLSLDRLQLKNVDQLNATGTVEYSHPVAAAHHQSCQK